MGVIVNTDKENPKVSVIISCYNGEKFIGEAIESVINQTYENWELIIVDDGSTDDSKNIVKSYLADDRVNYLEHSKNRGIAAARNTAIAAAKGRSIAFLDQDDVWLPKKLGKQIEVLENDEKREIGIVYSDAYLVDSNLNIIGYNRANNYSDGSKKVIVKKMFKHKGINTCTILIRKECFDTLGLLDEDLFGTDDYDFLLRAAGSYGLEYLNEPLAKKRVHNRNTARVNRERIMEDGFLIVDKAIGRYPFLEKLKKQRISKSYCGTGLHLLMDYDQRIDARKKLRKAIQVNPLIWQAYLLYLLTFLGRFGQNILNSLRNIKRTITTHR